MSRYYAGISDIRGIIIRADPFRRQWIGHTAFGCYHKASVNRVRNGFERRTPEQNSTGIAVLLCTGLLLAGCSSNSGSGTYSGSVYTVKRGDTLYRISRATGTSVKELARLNGISPPYTIEVGQRIKVRGSAKSSSSARKTSNKTATKLLRSDRHLRCQNPPAAGGAALLGMAC